MASTSQSPRALRDSTEDPEQYAKGVVQLDMERPSKTDHANSGDSDPWQHQGDEYKNLYW
jgi:hypothetical protein